jgi:hypothetical protein
MMAQAAGSKLMANAGNIIERLPVSLDIMLHNGGLLKLIVACI